jgi:hypothetical protein
VTSDEFCQSLTATEPPAGLTHALAGLWWDTKGGWKKGARVSPAITLQFFPFFSGIEISAAFSDSKSNFAAMISAANSFSASA